jgi:hypothetical protein
MNLQRCDVVLAGGAWQQDLIAFYPGGANLVLNFTTTNVVPCGLDMCGTLVGFQGGIILSGSVGGVDPSRYGLFGNHNAAGSPRPRRRCWTSRPDLGERRPSRLVATAAENRLKRSRVSSQNENPARRVSATGGVLGNPRVRAVGRARAPLPQTHMRAKSSSRNVRHKHHRRQKSSA